MYERHRAEGLSGWDSSEEDYNEFKTHINRILNRGVAPSEGRVLELGCGAGNMTIWLARKGYEAYGVDIAPAGIAWARERAQEQDIQINFTVGNVLDLAGYSNAFFDFALDGHCLHCIIGTDRRQFFSSVRRVLKPKGYFLVHTMCSPVDGKKTRGFDPESMCTIIDGIATRYFGPADSILEEIKQAGFEVVHWEIERGDTNDTLTVEAIKPEPRK